MSTKKLSKFLELLNHFELQVMKHELKDIQKARMDLLNFIARLMKGDEDESESNSIRCGRCGSTL